MTAEIPGYWKNFTVWREDEYFIIKDDEGETTQGKSLIEALLMMADLKRGDEHDDQTMMKMAADTFIIDPKDERFLREELQGCRCDEQTAATDCSEGEGANRR